MTQDKSKDAFEEWWKNPSSELAGHKATALNAWQASEQRILDDLGGEEMNLDKISDYLADLVRNDKIDCISINVEQITADIDSIIRTAQDEQPESYHKFGNMATHPRKCFTCGKDEYQIQEDETRKMFADAYYIS